MADTLALLNLYDGVVARFLTDGTAVPQLFGWRSPAQGGATLGDTRIVWYPGDPRGQLGKVGAPRSPGGNPRSLATIAELFTVEITGCDPSSPFNERLQYQATRFLLDAWLRAVALGEYGRFLIQGTEWLIEKNEVRFGATIRVVATIEAMVPDTAYETAPVDTTVVLATTTLDNTETTTIPEPTP